LADGPAKMSRFNQPRQACQLQGAEGVVLRLMAGRSSFINERGDQVENVNRNLVLSIHGGTGKKALKVILTQMNHEDGMASDFKAWRFHNVPNVSAGPGDGPGSGVLYSCSSMQHSMGVVMTVDKKALITGGSAATSGGGGGGGSGGGGLSSLSSTALSSAASSANHQHHPDFNGGGMVPQELMLCNVSEQSFRTIEEQIDTLAQESQQQQSESNHKQVETFKIGMPFVLQEDGQLTSGGKWAVGLAGEFPSFESDRRNEKKQGGGGSGAGGGHEEDEEGDDENGEGAVVGALSLNGVSLDGADLTLVPIGSPKALRFSFANRDPLRGAILVADCANHAIRLINARDNRVRTLIGGRTSGHDNGPINLLAPKAKKLQGGGGAAAEVDDGGDENLPDVGDIIEAMDFRVNRWRQAAVNNVSGHELVKRLLLQGKPEMLQVDAKFNLKDVFGERPWSRSMLKLLPDKQTRVVFTVTFLETGVVKVI
jgi:hypothetical protein